LYVKCSVNCSVKCKCEVLSIVDCKVCVKYGEKMTAKCSVS
jgi:hypothetical protein